MGSGAVSALRQTCLLGGKTHAGFGKVKLLYESPPQWVPQMWRTRILLLNRIELFGCWQFRAWGELLVGQGSSCQWVQLVPKNSVFCGCLPASLPALLLFPSGMTSVWQP